jgi:hypothetical protein
MRRISQINMYRAGGFARLRELQEGDPFERWTYTATTTEIYVRNFIPLNGEALPQSAARAAELAAVLNNLIHPGRGAGPLTVFEVQTIERGLSRFEVSLEDELERLPTFVVDSVGAYSFDQLISHADSVFPETVKKTQIIPEQVLKDIRCAGACLAFDQSTACGFHAFRAADAMIRAYYAHFIGSPPPGGKEPRDWAGYIGALRTAITKNPPPKIPNDRTVELLDSIRATDRNPVIHPEQDLDAETALATFDLCKNAITLMAIDIRDRP